MLYCTQPVLSTRLLRVYDIREKFDAAIVVERLGLELVGDGPRLVAHVASVVAEVSNPRDDLPFNTSGQSNTPHPNDEHTL